MPTTSDDHDEIACRHCGERSAGRFCSGCGAPLRDVVCDVCGHAAKSGERFCTDCGSPLGAASGKSNASNVAVTGRGTNQSAKLIGGAALLVLVAFVAGEAAGRSSTPAVSVAESAPNTPLAATPSAPDISSMSPEERASRLFNRVMQYSEAGKLDSARFFAPMAIQAYQMIGPVDSHMRYDIGAIAAAVGDVVRATAEADTILAAQPRHLLGLTLAIRAAGLAKDGPAVARYSKMLVAAAPAERATGLKEYTEHSRDIDDALKKAETQSSK